MATETDRSVAVAVGRGQRHLAAGAVGGFLAGALFGGGVMDPGELMPLVASLYGLEGLVAGWLVHLAHSVVFGIVFAGVVSLGWLRTTRTSPATGAVVGGLYGLAVWLLAATVVMPAWVGLVTPMSPAVPTVNWLSFVGHLVYGVSLGALYTVFRAVS